MSISLTLKSFFMITTEIPSPVFSSEEIHQQLQRIFSDSIFSVSDILKRFLLFVVDESLEGRSNQIKEYTIGVNVLHKPVSFNPRQDAIIRIHAGRLRRALNQYYREAGAMDPIHIAIPKGSYLPVFTSNCKTGSLEEVRRPNVGVKIEEQPTIMAGQFMVSGEMHAADDRLRINIQMINTDTQEEVWSQVVEYKISKTTVFDIQDDIAKKMSAVVEDFYRFIKQNSSASSRMAVA
jgi:TolB-like protein